MSVQVTGADKVLSALRAEMERRAKGAERGLVTVGRNILADAKELCPVDSGDLKGSDYLDGPTRSGGTVTAVLGFGGTTAPYAAIVHERLDLRHEVGQAKFLQAALDKALPTLAADIAAFSK